jgi:hypothetical protein
MANHEGHVKRYGRVAFILVVVQCGDESNGSVAMGPGPRRPIAVLSYLELSVCMFI